MSVRSIIYIVASPRPRVGKTLLARLLTDYQTHNQRAVAAFDLNPHDAALSQFLPDQASVASITDIKGQMALFDRLVAEDDTCKIIDLGHETFEQFFKITRDIGLIDEIRRKSIAPVILFIGTPDRTSVEAYATLRALYAQGTMVPVYNEILGNPQYRAKFPPVGAAAVSVHVPVLVPGLRRLIDRRPLSLVGAPPADMPPDAYSELQRWLRRVFLDFREMELRVLLTDLQSSIQLQS